MRTAAEALAEALLVNEVGLAFCVAGESYIGLLDALRDRGDSCRIVTCRHEAGAAIMAEAYGKLTGRPGLCLVSRAPGLCQASLGLHVAYQDSTPLVVVVGQVPRSFQEREAQQELDYRRMLGQLAKWVVQIDHPDRIPELVHRAFATAASGRPGPVAVVVPEDLFSCTTTATSLGSGRTTRPSPGEDQLDELGELIFGAERPLMLVGGSGWTDEACAAIVSFAGEHNLPTCTGYRRADLFDNTHSCYVGELGVGPRRDLVDRVREADLVLAVGTRLSESTTRDYSLFDHREQKQALVHVHPSAEELGSVFRPTVAIQAGVSEFALAVASRRFGSPDRRTTWTNALRRDYLGDIAPPAVDDTLDLARVMVWLRERLPADAIVAVDVGAFASWPLRFLQFRRPGRCLGPAAGSMNYALPAGVAACLLHPDRMVVICIGDGGLVMSASELATIMRYGASPIILLFNNDMYASVRIHQERRHPGRVVATDLTNPDFPTLAQAHEMRSEFVTRTDEFPAAFERAATAGRATIIELRTDPDRVGARTVLSELREQAASSPYRQ